MKFLDLSYILTLVAAVLSAIGILIVGRDEKIKKKSPFKYIPITVIVLFLLSVIVISQFYGEQNEATIKEYKALANNTYYNDSSLVYLDQRNSTLDSLRKRTDELNKILASLEKQGRIIGKDQLAISDITLRIHKTNEQIGIIESYNTIIPIPDNLTREYASIGTTNDFYFNCPTDSIGDYIDIKLKFRNKKIQENVKILYLNIVEVKKGTNLMTFQQAYSPQDGVNAFRIPNFLLKDSSTLSVGYFMKDSLIDNKPRYERIECNHFLPR